MWRWLVLWQCVLVVGATLDLRFVGAPRYANSELNCMDYPVVVAGMSMRSFQEGGWRSMKKPPRIVQTTPKYRANTQKHRVARRIDFLLSNREEIIKEHAKLVQDINSLRQAMFFAPLADESKDYDESIFHEIIETTSTTTTRPTTTRVTTTRSFKPKTGIPIILLGGSNKQASTPLKYTRPSINLVGTSVTPLVKHPYPFVSAASSRHPVRICMASPTTYTATTRRPSLWERLIKAILPR